MDDADLADRLGSATDTRAVTALPDGSVDSYYEVYGDDDERVATTEEFGGRVAESEATSFPVEQTAREPGGQAVNAARQVHALGDDATLYGHLDDPVFETLDFETHSMGDPAEMRILDFADEEVLLAENSDDIAGWRLTDLEVVASDPGAALTADAVVCGNWVSVEDMSAAFRKLGRSALDGGDFVLDPGNLGAAAPERVRDLFDALGTLGASYDVVVSANRSELRTGAEAVGETDAETDAEIVSATRNAADATGVVLHETEAAVAATPDDVRRVPNFAVNEPVRHTGGGDRFSGALAHALARGWDWPTALELGNLAAAHYVETGDTGDSESLRPFLRSHELRA